MEVPCVRTTGWYHAYRSLVFKELENAIEQGAKGSVRAMDIFWAWSIRKLSDGLRRLHSFLIDPWWVLMVSFSCGEYAATNFRAGLCLVSILPDLENQYTHEEFVELQKDLWAA